MKKAIIALLFWLTTLALPATAWAACDPNGNIFGKLEAPLPGLEGQSVDQVACQDSPILYYVNFIIRVVTGVIVILALIVVVIGGYTYMTAGGNGTQLEKAKKLIGGALLGIILALTSFLILNTISPQFASQLKEPTLVTPAP